MEVSAWLQDLPCVPSSANHAWETRIAGSCVGARLQPDEMLLVCLGMTPRTELFPGAVLKPGDHRGAPEQQDCAGAAPSCRRCWRLFGAIRGEKNPVFEEGRKCLPVLKSA